MYAPPSPPVSIVSESGPKKPVPGPRSLEQQAVCQGQGLSLTFLSMTLMAVEDCVPLRGVRERHRVRDGARGMQAPGLGQRHQRGDEVARAADAHAEREIDSITVELFVRPDRPDRVLNTQDDYRPSHRQGRGAGRGARESYDAAGASRWPRPERQRTSLCGADHAVDGQCEGRHRYFRLSSPKVADMLDGIVAVAIENRPRYRPLSRQVHPFSHRVRDRPCRAEFDPPHVLPIVPRLDRTTPTHRGRGRSRVYEALL